MSRNATFPLSVKQICEYAWPNLVRSEKCRKPSPQSGRRWDIGDEIAKLIRKRYSECLRLFAHFTGHRRGLRLLEIAAEDQSRNFRCDKLHIIYTTTHARWGAVNFRGNRVGVEHLYRQYTFLSTNFNTHYWEVYCGSISLATCPSYWDSMRR